MIRASSVFDLMLQRLPSVYTGEPVDSINATEAKEWADRFAADAKRLDAGLAQAQREVWRAVLSLHGKTGDMVECEKAVRDWFEALTPDQRDPMRCDDHEDAQRLLTVLADPGKGFDAKLTTSLPAAWGLGTVANWTSLQIAAFKAKWEQSMKAIEEIKPLVPDPDVLPEAISRL